jgi:hypothetical protein
MNHKSDEFGVGDEPYVSVPCLFSKLPERANLWASVTNTKEAERVLRICDGLGETGGQVDRVRDEPA